MTPNFFEIEAPTLVPEAYNAYETAWWKLARFGSAHRGQPRTPEMDAESERLRQALQQAQQAAEHAWRIARAQALQQR